GGSVVPSVVYVPFMISMVQPGRSSRAARCKVRNAESGERPSLASLPFPASTKETGKGGPEGSPLPSAPPVIPEPHAGARSRRRRNAEALSTSPSRGGRFIEHPVCVSTGVDGCAVTERLQARSAARRHARGTRMRKRTGRSIPPSLAEGSRRAPSGTSGGIASQALYSWETAPLPPHRMHDGR